MLKIKYLTPVYCRIDMVGVDTARRVLNYKASFWKQGPFRKERIDRLVPLVNKNGMFFTGLLQRLLDYLQSQGIEVEVDYVGKGPPLLDPADYKLPEGYNLREEQIEALEAIINHQRGVIHFPTGSGKTVIFLTFLKMFPKAKVLIIVHTKDLFHQTVTKAEEFFPDEIIGKVGDGVTKPGRITVGMIQTLSSFAGNLNMIDVKDAGIIIVDEAHHVSKFKGMYAQVLSKIPAPVRIGFTGTLPYIEEAKMALESFLGPVITEKKISEVQALAKVKIKLRKIPPSTKVGDLKTYKDVYDLGVVYNTRANRMKLEDAYSVVTEGGTALILVTQIQHGQNLLEMARERYPNLKIDFVWSGVSGDSRDKVRHLLNQKKLDVVIADAVWREGVDIPTLGAIVNAAGGKSEIMTIQAIGRGLRKTPWKDEVLLFDYFDSSHRYLISHFGQRITLYFDEGWL